MKFLSKKTISILLIFCLIQSMFIPVFETRTSAEEGLTNLALGKTTNLKKSSHCSGCGLAADNAVDGKTTTFWAPTVADVTDNHNVWIEIDLGEETQVNEVVLKGLSIPYIEAYQISYKNAQSPSWVEAAVKERALTTNETAGFEAVQARYIRVSLDIISTATGRENILSEIEVYNRQVDPSLSPLSSLTVISDGQKVDEEGLTILPGETKKISVEGTLSSGNIVDVTADAVFRSTEPDTLTVDETGLLTAKGEGTAAIDISVTRNNVTKTHRLWVDSFGPNTDKSQINLAYLKVASASSQCSSCQTFASNAVDGDEGTAWRALSGDFRDDQQHWLTIDFGRELNFNKAQFTFNLDAVVNYELLSSNDGKTWKSFYQNRLIVANQEKAIFEKEKARYLKVNLNAKRESAPLIYELKVFNTDEAPVPPVQNPLTGVYLSDDKTDKYKVDSEVLLNKGESNQLILKGEFYEGGTLAEENAVIEFASSRPEVATVDAQGHITAIQGGVTAITAKATIETITQSTQVFVVVDDPEARIADTALVHPDIPTRIGLPAILSPGGEYPQVKVNAHQDGKLRGTVVDADNQVVYKFKQLHISSGKEYILTIPGTLQEGKYEIQMEIQLDKGKRVYDMLHFRVMDTEKLPEGQSKMAFLNEEGKLEYSSDFRGNQIMDYSTSGYMGGGVKIPDVQAKVFVEPGEGDDTERIQTAIETVANLPLMSNGFRGAVVLSKGTFEIEGTLKISKSGVVLRGSGEGEEGTILYATGKTVRNILEVGDLTASPSLLPGTKTALTDLYVPVGSHSFHVEKASSFKVGDTIMIRRYGNSSWIHEINMDRIPDRGTTVQWEPFTLDFDRVITNIKGNTITIDAPIPNAIETVWGGGEIYKYDDSDRLNNVGVENLRVDVEFDRSVTAVHEGKVYYSDEEKASTFLTFEYTKNAWMRNVTGLHLTKSIVNVGRHSKWITIQDSTNLEMVSIITGSRRYPFNYVGQLTLTQRVYSETARHGFTFDRQMAGPHVILDSQDVKTYARSEPHQRWAAGGLFDNVTGNANVMDRSYYGTGHGWAGANFVFWNHTGELAVQSPPTAQNYAIGLIGKRLPGDFKTEGDIIREDGYWEAEGSHVSPRSLFLKQLEDRLGSAAIDNIK
ncbi:discoidin domain-containing protein [Bacillus sp. OK048]|uniref:discoidin domain-containing protein n=1 Tax=Bacillus sp. OK048 TaxID=1882761 RepID=UPI00087F551C|nr:discoidin domain-containing protein [Bacillus sp. OK048]SDN23265.1 Ig-like domain (group 2) [Bacillus sp. OK048]